MPSLQISSSRARFKIPPLVKPSFKRAAQPNINNITLNQTHIMENGDNEPRASDPVGFLSQITGAPVTVKLNNGIVYKGTRIAFLFSTYLDSI